MSKTTILKGRHLLGWTSQGAAYCQLIRMQDQLKRKEWAVQNLGASFEDVIWTDETTVQMETHRRFCCRKKPKSLITNLVLSIPQKCIMGWHKLEWSYKCMRF